MKALLAVLILTSSVFAHAQSFSQTLALSWFYDHQGNTGIVSVIRETDPTTQAVTTELFYSFCVETTASVCQEGNGIVSNGDFTGTVYAKLKQRDSLVLQADTTVPGYSNWLCITPNYDTAGCDGGTAPATGGLISLIFTKTNDWARITINTDKLYNLGVLVPTTSSSTWGFAAHMTGNVLGVPANTQGITTGEMLTSTDATTLQQKWLLKRNAK